MELCCVFCLKETHHTDQSTFLLCVIQLASYELEEPADGNTRKALGLLDPGALGHIKMKQIPF